MYVPSDSFGGVSPERRAAQSMLTFFTFVAGEPRVSTHMLPCVPCLPTLSASSRMPTAVFVTHELPQLLLLGRTAAKIVMSQLEGIGRSDLGAYNAAGAATLRRFLVDEPMRDSAAWLSKLMQEDELLGGCRGSSEDAAKGKG